MDTPDDPRPPHADTPIEPSPTPDDEGGDEACWLDRVCPECGGLAAAAPPVRCPRCDVVIDGT